MIVLIFFNFEILIKEKHYLLIVYGKLRFEALILATP